ncbi:MAG: AAA family ATPase [Sulfolobales archaeon]
METHIHRLIIRNFKSIGEPGLDIELKPLTLLFGSQSSGKSNILEALWRFSQLVNNARRGSGFNSISSIAFTEPKYEDPSLVFHKRQVDRFLAIGVFVRLPDGRFGGIEAGFKGLVRDGEILDYYKALVGDETIMSVGRIYRGAGLYGLFVEPMEERVELARSPESFDPLIFQVLGNPSEDLKKRSETAQMIMRSVLDVLSGRYVSKLVYIPALRGYIPFYGSTGVSIEYYGELEGVGINGDRLIAFLTYLSSPEYMGYLRYIRRWMGELGYSDLWAGFIGGNRLAAKFRDSQLDVILDLFLASYGVRQILFLLVNLFSPYHTIILIEEPEISLHPESVSKLPLIFLDAIKMGKQIIATTHSPILPLAISRMARLAMEEGLCRDPNDLIAIYEVSKDSEGTRVERRFLNERGYIKGYISSFFKVEEELFKEWEEGLPSYGAEGK